MSSLGRRSGREPFFERHHFMAFAILAALGLAMTTFAVKQPQRVEPLQAAGLRVIQPVAGVGSRAAAALGGAWDGARDAVGARAQLEEARARIGELELRVHALEPIEGENGRLRELLDLRESAPLQMVAAEVLWVQRSPDWLLVIDKGSADGIREDQSVITPAGVVGKVLSVDEHAARVQALLDGGAGIAVMVGDERRHVDAIAQGAAGDTCRLEHVPLLAEVVPGDRVLTSGWDLVHVSGLLVGTVEEVQGNGVHQEIVVRPAVDFTRLEGVIVVTSTSRAKEQARGAVRAARPKREERP